MRFLCIVIAAQFQQKMDDEKYQHKSDPLAGQTLMWFLQKTGCGNESLFFACVPCPQCNPNKFAFFVFRRKAKM